MRNMLSLFGQGLAPPLLHLGVSVHRGSICPQGQTPAAQPGAPLSPTSHPLKFSIQIYVQGREAANETGGRR